jgi:hypothetical protein
MRAARSGGTSVLDTLLLEKRALALYLDGNALSPIHGSFTMLTALILICSLAATPDLSDCSQSNAYTIYVPGQFANPSTCFMHGQAYLAERPIGEIGQDERVKFACVRIKTTTESAG